MTRSLHPLITACGHRVRFVGTWREEFFEAPCRIKICNNRIGANGFLNQRCALTPDLESILRAWTGKIVLQHNLPMPDSCTAKTRCPGCNDSLDHFIGA